MLQRCKRKVSFQALDEEKLVYERSSSKNIYLNVAVNTLKKLRSKSSASPSPVTSRSPVGFPIHVTVELFTSTNNDVSAAEVAGSPYTVNIWCFFCVFPAEEPGSVAKRKPQSHEEVLGGRLAATTSFTVNRTGKQQEEKLIGERTSPISRRSFSGLVRNVSFLLLVCRLNI